MNTKRSEKGSEATNPSQPLTASPAIMLILSRCLTHVGMPTGSSARSSFTALSHENVDDIKEAIFAACAAGAEGRKTLRVLVTQLEPLCEVERCGTSALLDGYWRSVYVSDSPAWTRGSRELIFGIESFTPEGREIAGTAMSPGTPGLLTGPAGNLWRDVSAGRGVCVQRACGRLSTREVRATYTWLGGDAWDLHFASRTVLLLGLPIWRRPASALGIDLDHGLCPTYVDGELLIMRSPAVRAGKDQLRAGRVYLLRRLKNQLWQDNSFRGLTDVVPLGIDP
uniref:Uncharacterized protein n=1 Tax=Calcidiscus leptoporus TaxID=127549 RepID=A0A7S0IPB2_9EUKA